jgi:hypothetical protein
MEPWLRVVLILLTVGGGFSGIVTAANALLGPVIGWESGALAVIFLTLFVFVTATGIFFTLDQKRLRPLLIALAIQIPWLSTPRFVYKFATGFYAALNIGDALKPGRMAVRLWSEVHLGSIASISWSRATTPWGVGINWVALVLFLFTWRTVLSKRAPVQFVDKTAELLEPE